MAGDVPFEAASCFAGGFSLADAFGYVGPGFGAVPSAGDGDGVDGAVELAVTVAAEPGITQAPTDRYLCESHRV